MAKLNLTTQQPEYYADGGNSDDGTVTLSEEQLVYVWCVPIDIIGFLVCGLVLGLTGIRHKVKFNLGPRIFTFNMMFFDVIHCIVSFLRDYSMMNTNFLLALFKAPLGRLVLTYGELIRGLGLLVFNCSLIPMMVMSIVACYSTQRISDAGAAIRFAGIVCVADLVPLIIQVINVDTGSTLSSWSSLVYMIATFILYIIQLGLTAFALTILHFKSKQFKNTSNKKDTSANKNLVRLLMFSAGPCLLQIPFAMFLLVHQVADGTTMNDKMALAARVIFALKPIVDATFTLLFLGEYRQYTLNFYKWLREKVTGRQSGTTSTRISEFQRKPAPTHSAMPSTVSRHVVNIPNGARPSAIGRSSSLPTQVATISS